MRVLAFPSACCLPLTRMGPAVCWVAAVWREGGTALLGTSLPAKSPACNKYCLQSCLGLVRCWQEKGSIPEEMGSSLRACIPTWNSAFGAELQGSLSASHHARAELPKSRPLGMMGVENAVGRSWPGWPRCKLCSCSLVLR